MRPRWDDGGAVMAGKIRIGAVDHRLVKACPGDAGLEIVAHRLPGSAAEKGECADVRGNPVWQALAQARLGIGVVRGAEHGDEDLRRADLASDPIDHLQGVTGIIDEQLLAGDVNLAQCRLKAPRPFLVAFAEPRIAEAVGVGVAVLLPQAASASRPARRSSRWTIRPIGLWTLVARQIGWRRIEPVLEPNTSSSSSGGNGQVRPARRVRLRYLLTVPWAKPRLRATARCDMPTL